MKTHIAATLAAALAAAPAAAATTTVFVVDADITVTSGDLFGQTLSAQAVADLAGLAGVGEEFIPVQRLRFDFGGETYTEADGDAELAYFDNAFLGLSFSVDTPDAFSFIPGFFSVDEAFFSYQGLSADGDGDIAYAVAPIPLPAPFALLAVSLAGLVALRRKV
ncbi:hypothetical protein [Rubrimonas cliftonensis]|nr:hypothetical protein [Rubrimonas cliftonensis]